MEHVNIPAGEIHSPHNWEFANSAVRIASGVSDASLIGRVAIQLSDNTTWRLSSVLPTVWSQIVGGIPADVDYLQFDTAPETVPTTTGALFWDNADGNKTLSLVMDGATGTTQQIGEETYYRVKASSAITEGHAVMVTGSVGASGVLTAARATGLTYDNPYRILGIATENIAANGFGFVTAFGMVRGFNTTGASVGETWADGDALYYSPVNSGSLTNIQPQAPVARALIAHVIHAGATGSVFVRPVLGSAFGSTDGNVKFTALSDNNFIVYNAATGLWENRAPAAVKTALSLGNVDNTSDADKPVSTATAAALGMHTGNTSNPHSVTKAQVGLGNVDNTSDADKPVSTATASALATKETTTNKGAPSGYAGLDAGGKVPAAQLPSFVDDVIEAASFAALPVTGESGKIYITLGDGKTWRWGGTAYAEISASPGSTDAVPEGVSNLYHTAARVRDAVLAGLSTASSAVVTAADSVLTAFGKLQAQITGHVGSTTNPHSVTKAQVGLGNVDNTPDADKPVSTAQQAVIDLKLNAAHPSYTGTLTGGTGVINIGSGQVYKDASGNVGIGTASPLVRLAVVDSSNSYAAFFKGNAASPNIVALGTTAGGASIAGYTPGFASTADLIVNPAGGNVGIGTASPAAKLHVASSGLAMHLGEGVASAGIDFRNRLTAIPTSGTTATIAWLDTPFSAGGLLLAARPGVGSVVLSASGGQDAVLNPAGNLGLGVTPSAWSVSKAIEFGGTHSSISGSLSSVANTQNLVSNAYFDGSVWRYKFAYNAQKYTIGDGSHTWFTAPIGTAGNPISFTQAMTLDANSNLTVTGASVSVDALYGVGLRGFKIKSGGAEVGSLVHDPVNGESRHTAGFSGYGGFHTFYANGAEVGRFDSSGNLLVGTTSLSLSDSNNVCVQASGSTSALLVQHASGNASGNAYGLFVYGGSAIGSITQNGTTGVLYNTSSDARLKENISDADNGSGLIDQLQVRKFDWKADGSHQRYGFVAQELDAVYPEAVSKPADPDEMMGVDYSKLVPLLVQEVQSLRARLAALEAA